MRSSTVYADQTHRPAAVAPDLPDASECPDWRDPGAVTLVSCYELGHQPLGVASALGFLREAGYQPWAMDIASERFSEEKAARARFVGISVPMHTALRLGVEVARRVRGVNPDSHICFYGLYALLNADYLLENGGDSCIGGEFEEPLRELVDALAASRPVEGIAGVATRDGEARPYIERLALVPPSREGLPPVTSYARLARDGKYALAAAVEASRGCKHLCLHCPIPPVYGGRFFVVPAEVVLKDVRGLAAQGVEHITFADPDFLNGPRHALRVARALHREFPRLTFDFTAKVEHLTRNRDMLPEMKELGCLFIVSAVESLSDSVLENLAKGHTRRDVFEALVAVRAAGISLRPSFVAFTPWTTAEDYFELLDFVEEEGLVDEVDPVQLAIRLLVPPGSSLLDSPHMHAHLEDLDAENFIHRWRHPDPRMDRLHEEVQSLVEEADAAKEDPARTYARIRERAARVLDESGRAASIAPPLAPDRLRPPRLTESWFC